MNPYISDLIRKSVKHTTILKNIISTNSNNQSKNNLLKINKITMKKKNTPDYGVENFMEEIMYLNDDEINLIKK
jgi:hypothetical protein